MATDPNGSIVDFFGPLRSQPHGAGASSPQYSFSLSSGQPTTGFGLRTFERPALGSASPDFGWMDGSANAASGKRKPAFGGIDQSFGQRQALPPIGGYEGYQQTVASLPRGADRWSPTGAAYSRPIGNERDPFESWGREHYRERGDVVPPAPWLSMNGHRYETYGSAVWATLRGEGRALNPFRAYEGLRNAVTYLAQDHNRWLAVGDVGVAMIEGIMPWKQESLEDWGESGMAGILSFAPELKRMPNPFPYGLRDPMRLPNSGGWSLFAVTKEGESQPVFRFDWHRLSADDPRIIPAARGRSLPHWHYARSPGMKPRHRPWEVRQTDPSFWYRF